MTHETQPEPTDGSVLNTIDPAQSSDATPNVENTNGNATAVGNENTNGNENAGDSQNDSQNGQIENDEIAQLRAELAEAQAKAAGYLDQFQRSAAEFQNVRRRQEKQLLEESERANAGLIRRLLPVLDDLELAFQNVPPQLQNADGEGSAAQSQAISWFEGLRQIQKKLLDILAEQGVTQISTSGAFDPVLHEAIGSEPSDSVESGHIISALRSGYEYKGRVLRPALVRVAL